MSKNVQTEEAVIAHVCRGRFGQGQTFHLI